MKIDSLGLKEYRIYEEILWKNCSLHFGVRTKRKIKRKACIMVVILKKYATLGAKTMYDYQLNIL